MVTLKSTDHSIQSSLIWIDDNDTIYEHPWPQHGMYMPTVPSLTHCKHDRLHLASCYKSASLLFDSWLEFDDEEDSWCIHYNWPLRSLDKGRHFKSSTPLDFLDNRDILNLILSSNCNIENNEGLCQSDRHIQWVHSKGAQFVFNADLFGILLPSDSVLFVFGREEKGWKTINLRSRPVEASGSIGELLTHIDSCHITDNKNET